MESFKIRVNPEQSKIVQDEMLKRGYEWSVGSCTEVKNTEYPYLYFEDLSILYGDTEYYFKSDNLPELTFKEFKTKYLNTMKEFKIEVPKGYEIDTEKSTFERIVFKEAKPTLPQSWEELKRINGAFISGASDITPISDRDANNENRNIIPTRELAEAMLAMCQLLQLRDRWNGDWTPDWADGSPKWCIVNKSTALTVDYRAVIAHPISFKTKELAEQFFAAPKIRELLEIAKPLL